MSFVDRLQHGWNAFMNRAPTSMFGNGVGSSYRPDRQRYSIFTEKSLVTPLITRIAIDVAAIDFKHIRVNDEGRMIEEIKNSSLNRIFKLEANIDQSGRAFIQDIVESLLDEGSVAVVPVDTSINPEKSAGFNINSIRVGRIIEWFPKKVRVRLYNENTGLYEEIIVDKKNTAIIQNPLYEVMNEPNSTLKRLTRKLSLLDAIDEQSGSGKLDLIIQLPYSLKNEAKRAAAEERQKEIEMQLTGTKYGIAYIDGTERITQLNRPAMNNLMEQVTYLTNQLRAQLGLSEAVFNGTADEKEMLNYQSRTVDPIVASIATEFSRSFISSTARTQGQIVRSFRNPFKFVAIADLANVADKFTRNEIISSNEFRDVIGYIPSKQASADELRNKNIAKPKEEVTVPVQNEVIKEEVNE